MPILFTLLLDYNFTVNVNSSSCCFPGNVIPPEKVHEMLFVGSQRQFKKPSHPAVTCYNKTHTEEQVTKMKDKLLRKEAKLRKRLAAHGIDYDFPGFVSVLRLG